MPTVIWPQSSSWLNYLFHLAILGNGSSGGSDFTLMTKHQMNRFLKVVFKSCIEMATRSLTGKIVSFCGRTSVPSRYHSNEVLNPNILSPYFLCSFVYADQLDPHGHLCLLVHYCIFRYYFRVPSCSSHVEL